MLIFFEIFPTILLLLVSIYGVASPNWGRLCFSTALTSLATLIITSTLLVGWNLGDFLGYFGGLITVLCGVFVYEFNKNKMPSRKSRMAFIAIMTLYLLETVMNITNQAMVNNPPQGGQLIYATLDSIVASIFNDYMLASTYLMILILLYGAIDGVRILVNDHSYNFFDNFSSSWNKKRMAKIEGKGKCS